MARTNGSRVTTTSRLSATPQGLSKAQERIDKLTGNASADGGLEANGHEVSFMALSLTPFGKSVPGMGRSKNAARNDHDAEALRLGVERDLIAVPKSFRIETPTKALTWLVYNLAQTDHGVALLIKLGFCQDDVVDTNAEARAKAVGALNKAAKVCSDKLHNTGRAEDKKAAEAFDKATEAVKTLKRQPLALTK